MTTIALQGVKGRLGPEGKQGFKGEKVRSLCLSAIILLDPSEYTKSTVFVEMFQLFTNFNWVYLK